jgi:GDP-D-mannose dehydratase
VRRPEVLSERPSAPTLNSPLERASILYYDCHLAPAGDYVRAMWSMLQQPTAEDYVIATGVSHSIRDLVSIAFSRVGLDWEKYVRFDPKFLRPAEVDHLIGNPAKAKRVLGWEPAVNFKQLVEMMVDADMERLAHHPRQSVGQGE